MASIAFVVTMTDGTQMTKTASVTDADVARLLAWGMATFPAENDANGVPLARTTPWVVGRWIEATVAETFAKILSYERSEAAKTAQDAVSAIPVSIS